MATKNGRSFSTTSSGAESPLANAVERPGLHASTSIAVYGVRVFGCPTARPRLVEIVANLRDLIDEAMLNGWLGEVNGLQHSLNEAAAKLVRIDRTIEGRSPVGPVNLRIPIITDTAGRPQHQ
jgi:hypothetical protein